MDSTYLWLCFISLFSSCSIIYCCFLIQRFKFILSSSFCFLFLAMSLILVTNFLISSSKLLSMLLYFSLSWGIILPSSLRCCRHASLLRPSLTSLCASQRHTSTSSRTVSARAFSRTMLSILLTNSQILSSSCRVSPSAGGGGGWRRCGGSQCLGIVLVDVLAALLMCLALELYLRVLRVSSQNLVSEVTQAIMTVFELPPRESLRILVSFESRKGMNTGFFCSDRMLMHLPNVSRLLFMLTPSTNRLVQFCPAFQLPARSIMNSLDSLIEQSLPSLCWVYLFMLNCRMAWDREETSLFFVAFIALLVIPYLISICACSSPSILNSFRSLMNTPFTGSSRMVSG